MIIGVSGGDVYLGIKLLKDSLQALSSSKGSQRQYVDTVKQLETLEICLKVAQCKLPGLDEDDSQSIVARAITECTICIESYQREVLSKYEQFFGDEFQSNARRKFLRELKKIQWLHDKEKIETLSRAITSHVQIISLACSIGSLPPPSSPATSSTVQPLLQSFSQASLIPEAELETSVGELDPAWKGKQRGVPVAHSPQLPCDSAFSHPESSQRKSLGAGLSRTTTATTQSAISFFSQPASDATSMTSRSTATTITLPGQWVDETGVCQNPSCQKRSFVQKKAFSLYMRLSSSDKLTGPQEARQPNAQRRKAGCEHVLLYFQSLSSADSVNFSRNTFASSGAHLQDLNGVSG